MSEVYIYNTREDAKISLKQASCPHALSSLQSQYTSWTMLILDSNLSEANQVGGNWPLRSS